MLYFVSYIFPVNFVFLPTYQFYSIFYHNNVILVYIFDIARAEKCSILHIPYNNSVYFRFIAKIAYTLSLPLFRFRYAFMVPLYSCPTLLLPFPPLKLLAPIPNDSSTLIHLSVCRRTPGFSTLEW